LSKQSERAVTIQKKKNAERLAHSDKKSKSREKKITVKEKTRHKMRYREVMSSKGFTLLEVLAAVAVLSIASVAIFQLFSANLKGISASEDYINAVLQAESRMREILDNEELSETEWEETGDNGYAFSVSVMNVLDEKTEALTKDLLQVNLTVNWSKGTRQRSYTLSTLKLVNKEI
jgi:general secretion pathway protein I